MENSLEKRDTKGRYEYLDIAKGILILLVIRGHIRFAFLPAFLHEDSFYRVFHVTAFLVLGGLFLKDDLLDSPLKTLKKKYHSLFKKALYFFLPAVLLHNVFLDFNLYPHIEGNEAFMYFDGVKDWAIAIGKALTGMSFETMVQPTWFALTLFFAIVFISCLQWTLKKINMYSVMNMVTIMVALCVVSCLLTHCKEIHTPGRIMSAISSMVLIYMGHLYWKSTKNHFASTSLFFLCLFINIGITYTIGCNPYFMALISNVYNDPLTLIVGGLSGTYIVCYLGRLLESTKIGRALAVCGKESFYLMAMHMFFFRCLGLMFGKYFGLDMKVWEFKVDIYGFMLLFFGSILLTLLFCFVKNRIAQFVASFQ